jgi:heterodisulfide reductase subunit B
MEWRREPRSHVREDGAAKAAFHTETDARFRANQIHATSGKRLWPYECSQRPEHYHLTKDQPDLKETG